MMSKWSKIQGMLKFFGKGKMDYTTIWTDDPVRITELKKEGWKFVRWTGEGYVSDNNGFVAKGRPGIEYDFEN